MKNNTIVFSLLSMALMGSAVGGCKKSMRAASPSWTSGTDIYFAGTDANRAVYWKNGVETVLGPGQGNGIVMSGSTVYVAGTADKTGGTVSEVAALWTNGEEQDLETAGSRAFTPLISGADVYVTGTLLDATYHAVYWKNGQRVNLTSMGQARGIAVSGPDVYVSGGVCTPDDSAVIWKDGQRMPGVYTTHQLMYGQILVSGGHMYVAVSKGYFVDAPDQYVQLADAASTAAVSLNGSDVYVVGARVDSVGHTWGAYWKNGVLTRLPNYPGTDYSGATGIVLAGSDVYVVGSATVNGYSRGVYWKNGVEETLTNSGTVNGVAVGYARGY